MAGTNDDVSLGEVARRVDKLDAELVRQVEKLEKRMDLGFEGIRNEIRGLAFVPAAVYQSDQTALNNRVTKVEEQLQTYENRSWQIRFAVIGVLFSGTMTIIVTAIMAYIGLTK